MRIEHTIGQDHFTVEITDVRWENDGIGAYECHGFKGFDRGTNYIDDFSTGKVLKNGVECTAEESASICDMLYDNDEFMKKLEAKYQDEYAREEP